MLLIVPGAINQFSDVGSKLGPLLDNARAWAQTVEPKPVGVAIVGLVDSVSKTLQPSSVQAPPPDQLIQLGFTAAEAVISIVSVLTLVYFWLTERARLQRFALALVPAERRQGTREAWNQIELRLGGWVRGELILMGFVGVTTTIAYFLIGLQGPLLLGVLAALFEAIPLVGPALGALPALAVAALTGDPTTVLLVAGVYFVIQLVEGNVLVPLVMHNTIGVPPFLVFVSILAGGVIAGIPGCAHRRAACRLDPRHPRAAPGARVARAAEPREAYDRGREPRRRRGADAQLARRAVGRGAIVCLRLNWVLAGESCARGGIGRPQRNLR